MNWIVNSVQERSGWSLWVILSTLRQWSTYPSCPFLYLLQITTKGHHYHQQILFSFNKTENFDNKNLEPKTQLQKFQYNKIKEIETWPTKASKLVSAMQGLGFNLLNSQDKDISANLIEELLLLRVWQSWSKREMGWELRGGFLSWDWECAESHCMYQSNKERERERDEERERAWKLRETGEEDPEKMREVRRRVRGEGG